MSYQKLTKAQLIDLLAQRDKEINKPRSKTGGRINSEKKSGFHDFELSVYFRIALYFYHKGGSPKTHEVFIIHGEAGNDDDYYRHHGVIVIHMEAIPKSLIKDINKSNMGNLEKFQAIFLECLAIQKEVPNEVWNGFETKYFLSRQRLLGELTKATEPIKHTIFIREKLR